MKKHEIVEEVVETEVEFVELDEQVSLSGDNVDQLTGKKGGRVLGLGCDD